MHFDKVDWANIISQLTVCMLGFTECHGLQTVGLQISKASYPNNPFYWECLYL